VVVGSSAAVAGAVASVVVAAAVVAATVVAIGSASEHPPTVAITIRIARAIAELRSTMVG
jgi:hypothetical protein